MKLLHIGILLGGTFASLHQAQADSCSGTNTTCKINPPLITDPSYLESDVIWSSSTSSKYQNFNQVVITPDGQLIYPPTNSSNGFGSINNDASTGGTAEKFTIEAPRNGTFYFFAHAYCEACDFSGSNLQAFLYGIEGLNRYLHSQINGNAGGATNALKRFYQTFSLNFSYDKTTGVVTKTTSPTSQLTTGPLRIPGPSGNQHPMTAAEAGAGWNYKVELRSLDMGLSGDTSQTAYHSFLVTPWTCTTTEVCSASTQCIVSEINPTCVNPNNTAEQATLVTQTVDQRDIQYVLIKSAKAGTQFSHYVKYTGVTGLPLTSAQENFRRPLRTLPDVRVYNNSLATYSTATPPVMIAPYVAPLGWIAGGEPDFHGQKLPFESYSRIRTGTAIDSTVLPASTTPGIPAAVLGTEYTNTKTRFDQRTTADWQSFTITIGATPAVTVKNSYTTLCTGCVNP